MRKFEEGEKVLCTDGRGDYCFLQKGEVYTVAEVDRIYFSFEEIDEYHKYDMRRGFELAPQTYPNPPHKHAEVIKAWADGAAIECKEPIADNWFLVEFPSWILHTEYRVKEQQSKSPQEIEKDAIVAEMQKLQERLDKLGI
jgi:hypothetical protein